MKKSFFRSFFFVALVLILCMLSFITVGARRSDIIFTENCGLIVEDKLYVTGLPEKTQANIVLNRIKDSRDIFIKDNNGTLCAETAYVGTGYKIALVQFNVTNKEYVAVVLGDINGNGTVQSADYMLIKKGLNGTSPLDGAFLKAADVNNDGRLTTADYIRVKRHIENKYELHDILPEVTPSALPEATANPNILGNSVEYANQVKNQVNTSYILGEEGRTAVVYENATMKLTHNLLGEGQKYVREFANRDGGVYFTNTFVPFLKSDSRTVYMSNGYDIYGSDTSPLRNGYYYYENHLRNIDFVTFRTLRLDLVYNTLPDSLRVNQRILIDQDINSSEPYVLGNELKLDINTVTALEIKDANGTHTTINDYDSTTVEYVAFDIEGAGVVALIYATDSLYEDVTITIEDGYYVIHSTMEMTNLTAGTEYNVALQLYNDCTHDFEGVRKAAYLERNPVTVTVANAENLTGSLNPVYDSTTGLYKISARAKTNWYMPDNQYASAELTANNDGYNRPIYLQLTTNCGMVATGLIRSGDGTVVAIPAEACKNFSGDDTSYESDIAYGDIIYPVYLNKNESVTTVPTILWNNWGQTSLVQLSSIQYYYMYLHMSMNLSETTCLTPSGAGGVGGNHVADFRGVSGDVWSSQPQYNHAGSFFWVGENGIRYNSEFTEINIHSSGPNYVEADLSYIAYSGNYKYTVTHQQFPSTDESRNYYSLEVTFLKNTHYNSLKDDLSLVTYYNSMGRYAKMAYRDAEGVVKSRNAWHAVLPLDPEGSFFTYYTNSNTGTENMAIFVKDYSMIKNGQESETSLAMNVFSQTSAALVINEDEASFKTGDKITVNFVLLPYGNPSQTHYDNALNVYNDTIANPLTTTVTKGVLIEDPFVPKIYAENNSAEFTLSGGADNVAVRINGFTTDTPIVIEEYVDGEWIIYDNSVKGYDGYYIYYNEDNSYGFSFAVNMGTDGSPRQFRVSQ